MLKSAGFSLDSAKIEEFTSYMENDIKQELEQALANQTRKYVAEIPEYTNLIKLATSLETLTPFGEGNNEPIFKIANMKIEYTSYIGYDNKHLKIGFAKNSAFTGLSDISSTKKHALSGANQKFAIIFWNHKQDENKLKRFSAK